jgi:hypothetical protein
MFNGSSIVNKSGFGFLVDWRYLTRLYYLKALPCRLSEP